MSTFDELPHDEATSAAYDGEPFDGPRPATTPDDAAAWAAAWGPIGDELRAVAPPADLLDDLRLAVLDEVAPRRPVVVPRRLRRDEHGRIAPRGQLDEAADPRALGDPQRRPRPRVVGLAFADRDADLNRRIVNRGSTKVP